MCGMMTHAARKRVKETTMQTKSKKKKRIRVHKVLPPFNRHYEVPEHVPMDWYSYVRLEKDRDGTFRVCYRLNGWRHRKSTGTNVYYKAMRYAARMFAMCDISDYTGKLHRFGCRPEGV